jgi:hypothetical protein
MWLSLEISVGSGGKTPCMLDLITRWRLVVNTCSDLFKTITKYRRYRLKVGKPYHPITRGKTWGKGRCVHFRKHSFRHVRWACYINIHCPSSSQILDCLDRGTSALKNRQIFTSSRGVKCQNTINFSYTTVWTSSLTSEFLHCLDLSPRSWRAHNSRKRNDI